MPGLEGGRTRGVDLRDQGRTGQNEGAVDQEGGAKAQVFAENGAKERADQETEHLKGAELPQRATGILWAGQDDNPPCGGKEQALPHPEKKAGQDE